MCCLGSPHQVWYRKLTPARNLLVFSQHILVFPLHQWLWPQAWAAWLQVLVAHVSPWWLPSNLVTRPCLGNSSVAVLARYPVFFLVFAQVWCCRPWLLGPRSLGMVLWPVVCCPVGPPLGLRTTLCLECGLLRVLLDLQWFSCSCEVFVLLALVAWHRVC